MILSYLSFNLYPVKYGIDRKIHLNAAKMVSSSNEVIIKLI